MEKVYSVVNKVGGILIVVGIVGVSVAGGDAQASVNQGFTMALSIGGAVVVVKELVQMVINWFKGRQ